MKVIVAQDEEILYARHSIKQLVEDGEIKLAGNLLRQTHELIEVNAIGVVFKQNVGQLSNLVQVLVFVVEVVKARLLDLARLNDSFLVVSRSSLDWDTVKNQENLLFVDCLVTIDVVAPKCNLQLLLERPHQEFHEEADELVVVDSLVLVAVHLFDDAVSDEGAPSKVHVLLGPSEADVGLIRPLDDT